MSAIAIAQPPSVSINGLARLDTRAILLASCSTAATFWSKRSRMMSSSVKALTMRMPCRVSCSVSTTRVLPWNWLRAIE